jgi:hypothetical protein
MFKSQQLRIGFLALSVFAFGAAADADQLLDAFPADATFCARLNNFDASIARFDQFLIGILPVPGGAAMMARGQLAAILGNPALPGIDTAGHVGVYGKISTEGFMSGSIDPSDPAAMGFFGVMVPVRDYDTFISANPNCGQPDDKRVSKIQAGPLGELALIRAGHYALVTLAADYDELVTEAARISSGSGAKISGELPASVSDSAQNQAIWICVNWAMLSPMMMPAMLEAQEKAGQMMAAQGNRLEQDAPDPMKLQKDVAVLSSIAPYASISINPQADKLSARAELFGSAGGSPRSQASLKDSPLIADMIKQMGASSVQQLGDKLAEITKLIPDAANADFAGTVPLPAEMTMATPGMPAESMPPIAYAIKLGDNNMVVDVVAPKAGISALAGMIMMMQMGQGGPEMSVSEGDMRSVMEMPSLEVEADESFEVVEAAPEMTVTIDPAVGGYVIEPMVGINGVRFGAAAAQMKQVIGEPKAVSGRMYQYFDSGFYVVADSDDKIEAIYCGALNSKDMVSACTCKTKQNIMMGSTRDDLINAYGRPTHIYEFSSKDTVRYEYDNIKSQFILKDNKVVQMVFRKPAGPAS